MANSSRRNFLKSAALTTPVPAAAAAAPPPDAKKPAYRRTAFAPAGGPRRLSENLFVFEDTCNVFVIRQGSRAVLIDFGSGKVLDHLPGLGITKVDWVLHTHHHRDQCQGDWKLAERKIPVAVPAHELHLFADAQNFWRNRRVFHLYYMRNDFNTITENIPVARVLEDYQTFVWQNIEFFVLPTPGHTLGSISLIVTVDGKRTAFTGDLIYAPGKILNLYDTQINYGGAEGIDFGAFSLARLGERKPEMLCPSHGDPIPDPADTITAMVRKLIDYYRFQTGSNPIEEGRPVPVSRHLICHYLTTSSFYAILSDSGKALFIDYGAASNPHFLNFEKATPVNGRIRFVEHSIDLLKREYGLKSVDVAMPSHMHDDHMNGFPHLRRHHGTKMWCYENMKDVFENPRGYNLGCILGEPFQVDRTFRDGETFRWEEFDFEVKHSPGHTEYQMALFTRIDGERCAFTGDAFFPTPAGAAAMRHNLIFRNHVESDSHLKSIHTLIDREPSLICPGHGRPFPVNRALMMSTEEKFRKQQQWFNDLLPEGETNFGMNPSWVRIYPYQVLTAPGETFALDVNVRNYKTSEMKIEIALVAPSEWRLSAPASRLSIAAGANAKASLRVTIPKDWKPPAPRFAIAADVLCDGKYLGQITEAVVEMRDWLTHAT